MLVTSIFSGRCENCLSRRPSQRSSAEQVDVQVKYGLPGAWSHVEDSAVSLLNLAFARDYRGSQMASANEFRIHRFCLLESRDMALGNDKDVRRRLRMDVFESEDMLVLVDLLRAGFAADDATEDAAGIIHLELPMWNDNKVAVRLVIELNDQESGCENPQ